MTSNKMKKPTREREREQKQKLRLGWLFVSERNGMKMWWITLNSCKWNAKENAGREKNHSLYNWHFSRDLLPTGTHGQHNYVEQTQTLRYFYSSFLILFQTYPNILSKSKFRRKKETSIWISGNSVRT